MIHPDEIPAWFAIPAIIALWGYFIADAIIRHRNRKRGQ